MRPAPYIGVTGFMRRQETDWLKPLVEGSKRPVMLGVLVSSKTLRGETNKWPNRYPRPEVLKDVFPAYGNTLNLIHFNTKEPEKLLYDLCLAQDLAGPTCHGFQLNIAWPDKKVLEDYRAKAQFSHKTIVLQCGSAAMQAADNSAILIAGKVAEYRGLIDYVLIDPSGGYGKEFNLPFVHHCLYSLRQFAPDIGAGIAGGLDPYNLIRLASLAEEFEFSIDAEGRLRTTEDHLDVAKSALYIQNADEFFRQHKRAA